MPTPRLLNLSAAIAARRIALQYLAAALKARRRLRDATDDDALHDFRVALRRLRSTLRAYRPWINARVVPRKLRKRLRRLARTTNAARDAEVALAWVRAQRRLTLHARPGVQRFMQELDLRRERAYAEIREEATAEFDRLYPRLRTALRPMESRRPVTRLRDVVSRLMLQQAEALESDLKRIRATADHETIHAARIDAKRLRYLLEPLADEIDGTARLIARLKRMQDRFGEFTDANVLARELAEAARRIGGDWAAHSTQQVLAGARKPMHEPQALLGVLLLATRVRRRQQLGFREIHRGYLGRHIAQVLAPIRRTAHALAPQLVE